MPEYVLGVDGGNTKTDFLLFTTKGRFVDVLRGGSCSHETQNMGYDLAYARLKEYIDTLLSRNGARYSQIRSAAYGLAGVNLPHQHDAMYARLEGLGIPHMAVSNDSILGIKAASSSGSGICSVNGTGTVTCGIDPHGKMMQIGGIGGVCGDQAGAHHIAIKAVARVHDQLFRCEARTSLCDSLMEMLSAATEQEYLRAIHNEAGIRGRTTEINIRTQKAALAGDPAAINILETVGDFLGRSAAGCMGFLDFDAHVEVVLIGSVWVKCLYPGMKDAFCRALEARVSNKTFDIKILDSPPATGAVIWALMLCDPQLDYTRTRLHVLSQLSNETYEQRIAR